MKPLKCAIVLTLSVAVLPTSVKALPKEPDYFCYMRTPAGKVVDLTAKLCSPPKALVSSSSASKPASKPLTADEKLRFRAAYSDAYCEARKQGQTDRQAGSAASAAIANAAILIVGVDRLDDVLADKSVFAEAVARKTVLCPQYADN